MLRSLLCLVAALALALFGAAVAAQAARGPVSAMVICGGNGAEVIQLDAQGNPVDGGSCCDCLQCLVMTSTLPVEASEFVVRRAHLPMETLRPEAVLSDPLRHSRPMPRGPPVAKIGPCVLPVQSALFAVTLEFGQVPRRTAMAADGQSTRVAR